MVGRLSSGSQARAHATARLVTESRAESGSSAGGCREWSPRRGRGPAGDRRRTPCPAATPSGRRCRSARAAGLCGRVCRAGDAAGATGRDSTLRACVRWREQRSVLDTMPTRRLSGGRADAPLGVGEGADGVLDASPSGRSRPATARSIEVLPAPEGPTRARVSRPTAMVASRSMRLKRCRTETVSTLLVVLPAHHSRHRRTAWS